MDTGDATGLGSTLPTVVNGVASTPLAFSPPCQPPFRGVKTPTPHFGPRCQPPFQGRMSTPLMEILSQS